MRSKIPELRRALEGRMTKAQRWVLGELLTRYEEIERAVERCERQIDEEVSQGPDPFVAEAVALLQTIPGIGESVAETIVSEIGVDMRRFTTDGHLASWAGICPGNNESAGKREKREDHKGKSVLTSGVNTSGLGGVAHEGDVSCGAVSALSEADGEEESFGGGGSQHPCDCLSWAGQASEL